MKVEQPHKISLFDVDFQSISQAQAIARFFQEISTHHSSVVGVGPEVLFEKGVVWFLNRLEIEFLRYPSLDEDITVTTWSRGFKRYKGFREYLMTSSKGEIARGTSVWIFFDVKRNRISKIPSDILDRYGVETEQGFDHEIDAWHSCGKVEMDEQIDISLRYSDFDVNGHVNNTVYFSFLETLYYHIRSLNSKPIKNIKIRYNQEIDRGEKMIQAGWKNVEDVYQFNIFDESTLYADGEIIPMV